MWKAKRVFFKVNFFVFIIGVFILSFGSAFASGEGYHSADYKPADYEISLSELLRVVQLYNIRSYHCDPDSNDGYAVADGDKTCEPHSSDYSPQDWSISLSELLRLIQLYKSSGYYVYPYGEDGFALKDAYNQVITTNSPIEGQTYQSSVPVKVSFSESSSLFEMIDGSGRTLMSLADPGMGIDSHIDPNLLSEGQNTLKFVIGFGNQRITRNVTVNVQKSPGERTRITEIELFRFDLGGATKVNREEAFNIFVGETVQFGILTHYDDGFVENCADAIVEPDNAKLSVDNQAMTAVEAGNVNVNMTCHDIVLSLQVEVRQNPVDSITVEPSRLLLEGIGSTVQLSSWAEIT